MGRVGAFLPVNSAREIFADPEAFVVSGTGGVGRAVPVAGGYRVTGRWPFGSGAPHATWFSPVCEVEESGQGSGRLIFSYAPRADVILHDNWQVSGLCATGSVNFEFQEVFVRTVSSMRTNRNRRSRARFTGCQQARSFRGRWRRFP